MPPADELPASLAELRRRQALELSPERFDSDTQKLLGVLDRTIAQVQEQARQEAEHVTAQRRQVDQPQGPIREQAAAQDPDAVVAASDEPAVLDPAAAHPDGLASSDRKQVTRPQQPEKAAAPQPANDLLTGHQRDRGRPLGAALDLHRPVDAATPPFDFDATDYIGRVLRHGQDSGLPPLTERYALDQRHLDVADDELTAWVDQIVRLWRWQAEDGLAGMADVCARFLAADDQLRRDVPYNDPRWWRDQISGRGSAAAVPADPEPATGTQPPSPAEPIGDTEPPSTPVPSEAWGPATVFQVTCPFCYHRINWLRLNFVCSGRNAPGYEPCQQSVDPVRKSETLFEELMYPVFSRPRRCLPSPRRTRCPHCRGRTGQHACPACHTPLPANFGGGFSPVIALIGARKTGKTVYLTVGAHHLRTVLSDRFSADVWLYGDEARSWLTTSVTAIFEHGTLPETTEQPTGRSEPLVFEWRRRSGRIFRRYHSSYLSFLDTAGDSLGTQRGVSELRFLTRVDAFIVMLDPFTLPGVVDRLMLPRSAPSAASNAFDVLTQVTDALRNAEGVRRQGRIRKPMAVAFVKIDAFRAPLGNDHPFFRAEADRPWYDNTAGRAVHDSVREMLREWGARDIDDHMAANYSKYQYFALSSLGRPPDYERLRVAEGGVQPLRVTDPLVWLLSLYKLVPRRRGDR